MFSLTCIFVLLSLICKGNMIRRQNTNLSHIFEKQQGFTNMGRLRQGKNVLDAKVRSQYDDGNSEITQTNDITDISQSPFLFLNYFFENEYNNDTLKDFAQDTLELVNEKIGLLEKELQHQKSINKKTHLKKKGHRSINNATLENGVSSLNSSTSKENYENVTEIFKNVTDVVLTENFKNETEKEKRPRKPKGPKQKIKISTSKHDISKIEYELTKLWCTTRVQGDAITKILECFNDKNSIQKIKYGAKVLINNKPKHGDINFLRCLSKIKTYPETNLTENQIDFKKLLKDCFTVHNIKKEHLYKYFSELVTKQQEYNLKAFMDCLSTGKDEDFKQHSKDCIDVDPVIFEVTDRIKRSFLKGSTLKPNLLKAGKSFTSNLKDFVAGADDDNDAQKGIYSAESDGDGKRDNSRDEVNRNGQDGIFSNENVKDAQKDIARDENADGDQKEIKFNFNGDFVFGGNDDDDQVTYSLDETFDA